MKHFILGILILSLAACVVKPEDASEDSLVMGYLLGSAAGGGGGFGATDNMNGTVTDHSTGLVWAKCHMDATGVTRYNSGPNDCTFAAASVYLFCNDSDNDCNGGSPAGVLDNNPTGLNTAPALGNSPAYNVCAALVLGGRSNWRVPRLYELQAWHTGAFGAKPGFFNDAILDNMHLTADSFNAGSSIIFTSTTGATTAAAKSVGAAQYTRCVSG